MKIRFIQCSGTEHGIALNFCALNLDVQEKDDCGLPLSNPLQKWVMLPYCKLCTWLWKVQSPHGTVLHLVYKYVFARFQYNNNMLTCMKNKIMIECQTDIVPNP